MIGNVWEWVADTFEPYAGFVCDPYKEYSEPHFGGKNVLKGGCWTTRSRLIREATVWSDDSISSSWEQA